MGKQKQKQKQKQKVVLPPELPPELPDDEIQVSDEDVEYVTGNQDYAGLFSKLDPRLINRHVVRVAGVNEDALESLYERRLRKKSLADDNVQSEVEPVDALPVKTLDGQLYYRTVPKGPRQSEHVPIEDEAMGENGDAGKHRDVVKLTKAEKRVKLKKLRKEAKKHGKEGPVVEEVQQNSQAEVLAEVQKDLSAEEASANKKFRLAELGTSLLMDPEGNIKSLKEMLQICKDEDQVIVKLGLKSLLAVFRDIIPGYRIRLPTEKEQAMVVSKAVKKMRFYESTLLNVYKAYLQKLLALEKVNGFQHLAVRCICTLLETVPHFNFRETLLGAVIKHISSSDDVIRTLCSNAVKLLFANEGKHGGEATVEAVQLIANLVKTNDCYLHPDSVEVFMSLSFDEDLGRPERTKPDNRAKNRKPKKGKRNEEPNQLPSSDKKKSKQELMSKTREEVNAEYKAASFAQDLMERKRMQSDTLSFLFETYFRILKRSMQPRSEGTGSLGGTFGDHPLLAPCLDGIGKFAHLIDLDFMADLMNYLRKLASGGSDCDCSSGSWSSHLSVSERLRCCIVAFKVMRNNLDALNVDLQDFFIQLYNLILDYRPGRDEGEVLAEALKIMLCDDRQHDMQRAAAFIKRLATFSLCFGSAESMAALVTVKNLLQKNMKCRSLLENDIGGGSVAGPIAKYEAYGSDPRLSGAFASVLWELNLVSKHYHPCVSTMGTGMSRIGQGQGQEQVQVYRSNASPQEAFMNMMRSEKEVFDGGKKSWKGKRKRSKGAGGEVDEKSGGSSSTSTSSISTGTNDEEWLREKVRDHFLVVDGMAEEERLRGEVETRKLLLQVYLKENKKQQKKKQRV